MTPDDLSLAAVDDFNTGAESGITTALDGALLMAGRGFRVFPIAPDSKQPLFAADWREIATADETRIRNWFTENPGMNYAVMLGESHAAIDLDVDEDKKNGVRAFMTLESGQSLDDLVSGQTFTVETPRGGRHLYLHVPSPVGNAHGFPAGIDVRGAHGYVLGPGSCIGGRRYQIITMAPILSAPQWVIDKLQKPRERTAGQDKPLFDLDQPFAIERAVAFLRKRSPAVEGIGGDDHTYATAVQVKDFGISSRLCLMLMLEHWNQRCLPPWRESELETKVQHAFSYGKDRPGSKGGGAMEAFDAELAGLDSEERTSDRAADTVEDVPAEAVKRMNRRWAIVMSGGANAGGIVDLLKPSEPAFVKPEAFHRIYANRLVKIRADDGKAKWIPASKFWLGSDDRREISAIVFEPTGSRFAVPARAHNIWQGFAIEPKEGSSHEPLLAHIRDNVCQADPARIEFVLAWLADMVQRPGDKPGVAIALRGEFGAGKSVLYEYLRPIFGPHAMSISRPEYLTGRFNFHLAGLVILGVEEGFWAGDKGSESVLKDLITAPERPVEQKFADPITIHSHVHILVTSNADWVVPAAAGDRRWAVLDVASARKDDHDYWRPIQDAKEADGPAHLLHFLLAYEYDRRILHRPPMTTAKAEQAIESLLPTERWFLSVLRGERDPRHGVSNIESDSIFGIDTSKLALTNDYENYCRERRLRMDDERLFWKRIRSILKEKVMQTRPSRRNPGRLPFIWLPDRDECRTAFADHIGCAWADLESIDDL